jgi:hypothetical protein
MTGKNSKAKRKPDSRTNNKKNEEIIHRFRIKRILNLISTLVIFGTAFFAFWYSNNRSTLDENTRTIIVAAIITLTIGALIFSVINWRCPACGKHLGGSIDPRKCQKCGFKFR